MSQLDTWVFRQLSGVSDGIPVARLESEEEEQALKFLSTDMSVTSVSYVTYAKIAKILDAGLTLFWLSVHHNKE